LRTSYLTALALNEVRLVNVTGARHAVSLVEAANSDGNDTIWLSLNPWMGDFERSLAGFGGVRPGVDALLPIPQRQRDAHSSPLSALSSKLPEKPMHRAFSNWISHRGDERTTFCWP
jgi:hypothetical protein